MAEAKTSIPARDEVLQGLTVGSIAADRGRRPAEIYLAEGLSVIEPFVPGGSIAIEIDDGSAAANTHILT